MVKNIFTIVKRNLQIYSNSKLPSLILILGPLILILIAGVLLQDTSLKNINAGIFSQENEFKNRFIENLEERSFIPKEEISLASCKQNVIDDITHVCIHLKGNSLGEQAYKSYDVDIYVDFSKQRIVWSIIGTIQGIVEKESYSVREALINDLTNNAENLESQLKFVENRLGLTLSTLSTLKQQSTIRINELDNIKSTLLETKLTLENIRDIGILPEPYSSDLSQIINDLSLIDSQINNVKNNLLLENTIINAEESIENIQISVKDLREELITLRQVNIERLANPVSLSYYSASEGDHALIQKNRLTLLDYFFPSFLIFFLLFDSLLFSTIMIIKERKSHAYIRNRIGINNCFTSILGNFLTTLLVIFIQISIIIIVASFFLHLNIFSGIYPLLAIILISITVFTFIGIAIGYLFNSYESTITASILILLLLLISSSTIIPAETLPKILYEIIKISPLTLLETKLRIILIFGKTLKLKLVEILALSSMFIISSLVTFLFYKKSKEKEI